MGIKKVGLIITLLLLFLFDVSAHEVNMHNFNFKNADIRLVLKAIAQKATKDGKKINIMMTPEVQGLVSLKLENVDWQTALNALLKTYGYEYIIHKDVIIVAPIERPIEAKVEKLGGQAVEPLEMKAFALNFSKAENIKTAIESLISPPAKITVEKHTNTLIIIDTHSNLMKLSEIIEGLDKITPQVLIEAKIIETTLGTAEKLGIDWTMRIAASGSKRPTTFPFTEKIKGTGAKMFPNVQVPSELERVTTTQSTSETGVVISTSKEEKLWHELAHGFPSVADGNFIFGTLDFSGLQAVLEILQSNSNTRILSNPHITTLNNQEASILVGTVVPIPEYEFSKDTGTRVIKGYKDQKIGIGLAVTPNINERDYVTLAIKPSVDEITGWTGPNNERPIISTRSAETTVMIKDGQTLVMGGLISEKKINSKKKIPFIGNIPILSFFFSKKDDTFDKTELLIFITPHIIAEGTSSFKNIELGEELSKDKIKSMAVREPKK